MKLLFDINILLDVVLDRAPWAGDGAVLLAAVESKAVEGYIAGHTPTTLYYVIEKERDRATAIGALSDTLRLLDVIPLDATDFRHALALGLKDFEDAVQAVACLKVGAEYLVTRNAKDFTGARVRPRSAREILALL